MQNMETNPYIGSLLEPLNEREYNIFSQLRFRIGTIFRDPNYNGEFITQLIPYINQYIHSNIMGDYIIITLSLILPLIPITFFTFLFTFIYFTGEYELAQGCQDFVCVYDRFNNEHVDIYTILFISVLLNIFLHLGLFLHFYLTR